MKNFYTIIAIITIVFVIHTQEPQSSQWPNPSKKEERKKLTYAEQSWQYNLPGKKQKKLFGCTLAWMSGAQPKETCQIRDFLKSLPAYEPRLTQEPARNVFLFYGEPGTGKTTGAKLIAEESKATIDLHIMEKFISEHGKNPGDEIKRIYDNAHETAKKTGKPVVIIFDDITEEEKQKPTLGILKTYLQDYSGNPYVITILTTNRDIVLFDKSFRSRCTLVYWPMPDEINRFAIIFDAIRKENHTTGTNFLKKLAKKTDDFSPRSLIKASQNSRIVAEAGKPIPDEKIKEAFKKEQKEIDDEKSFAQRQLIFFKWIRGHRL